MACMEEEEKGGEQKSVTTDLDEVRCVWTVIETFGTNALMKGTVFLYDQVLRC